jgi:hypothetical protein
VLSLQRPNQVRKQNVTVKDMPFARRIHRLKNITLKTTFLLLTMLFAHNASAQQTLLANAGKFSSVVGRQQFEVVEVIDARFEQENVGIIYHADTQQLEPIVTAKPLAEFLQEYFNMCSSVSSTQTKRIVKINFLEFGYRKIKNREYVWAYCDYEVFSKREGGVSYVDRQTAVVEGKVSGNSLMLDLAKINWLLWNDAFGQINRLWPSDKKRVLLPNSSLLQPISTPAFLFADSMRSGIYANYEELMQNKPSITNFTVTQKGDKWLFTVADSTQVGGNRSLRASKVWGFCQNGRVYGAVESKYFVEIEPLGTTFEMAGLALKSYQTGRRVSTNKAVMLGVIHRAIVTQPASVGGTALYVGLALFVELAKDPNQRMIRGRKYWKAIPIHDLR